MSFYGVAPIMFESVSNVTATPSVELGTIRVDGNEKYIYVYNGGNSQISKGMCATVKVTGTSGYTVSVSSISGDVAAGFCKHTTLTTGTYGWLVVRGFVDGLTNGMASTAVVVGDVIQTDLNGAVGKGITGPSVGKALTATGSAGTFAGFVAVY